MGEQITKRLIDKLIMDLRIATNPHLEESAQKEFLENLMAQRRALWGVADNTAPLDKDALDLLKSRLKNDSKAITVK